jgi:CO/xanthine dehydrogenase Mo-binding subunit
MSASRSLQASLTAPEAEDIAEAVVVEIEPETAVVTLGQALAPGAPLIHTNAKHNTVVDMVEPLMAMAELPGPYGLCAYKVRARGITTNTYPMAPYRGVSRPVITPRWSG